MSSQVLEQGPDREDEAEDRIAVRRPPLGNWGDRQQKRGLCLAGILDRTNHQAAVSIKLRVCESPDIWEGQALSLDTSTIESQLAHLPVGQVSYVL